jgi:hypothetical protein
MKRSSLFGVVAVLAVILTPRVQAQSNQLVQGTQMKLTLLNGLSTSVARSGDPFTAEVSDPVFLGGQVLLPAGSKVHGTVGDIVHPRHFALFRGQAAMNLKFTTLEIDGREIPAEMSILGIFRDTGEGTSKTRKDLKTEEGAVIHEKPDIKGTVTALAIGTGGGTAVGAIFSQVVRGFAIGLAGSALYVIQKKGKDVELPAQTGMLVRLDSPVNLPGVVSHEQANSGGN